MNDKVRPSIWFPGYIIGIGSLVFLICMAARHVHVLPEKNTALATSVIRANSDVLVESNDAKVPVQGLRASNSAADANEPAPETEAALAQFGLSAKSVIPMSIKVKALHPIIVGRQQQNN